MSEVPTTRPRDFAYEALAEVTNADPNANRGELNIALKSIREQSPELTDSYLLSAEIHDRAKAYRQVMGEAMLTPTALSKHWKRVAEEARIRKPAGTNLSAERNAPLPKTRGMPVWCHVWWYCRRIRKPRNLVPFPQQKGNVDNALAMSMDEYEALEREWIEAGSPKFTLQELIGGQKKRDIAAETVELLKEVSD